MTTITAASRAQSGAATAASASPKSRCISEAWAGAMISSSGVASATPASRLASGRGPSRASARQTVKVVATQAAAIPAPQKAARPAGP